MKFYVQDFFSKCEQIFTIFRGLFTFTKENHNEKLDFLWNTSWNHYVRYQTHYRGSSSKPLESQVKQLIDFRSSRLLIAEWWVFEKAENLSCSKNCHLKNKEFLLQNYDFELSNYLMDPRITNKCHYHPLSKITGCRKLYKFDIDRTF